MASIGDHLFGHIWKNFVVFARYHLKLLLNGVALPLAVGQQLLWKILWQRAHIYDVKLFANEQQTYNFSLLFVQHFFFLLLIKFN